MITAETECMRKCARADVMLLYYRVRRAEGRGLRER